MQEHATRDGLRGDFLLVGVRVIDSPSFIAGPVATTIMADLGADVIKLEPPDGDPYRHRAAGAEMPESSYNCGRALDLRSPPGAPCSTGWSSARG